MDDDLVRVRIRWRDMQTGQEGVYTDPPGHGSAWLTDGVLDLFMWEDGNYACDCNRALLFKGIQDHPCGSDRFDVLSIEAITDRDEGGPRA